MKKLAIQTIERILCIYRKALFIFIFFISFYTSVFANEITDYTNTNSSNHCKISYAKNVYSEDNMEIFFNGKSAHHAGAYSTAFRLLMPLAELGHKRAQTGIGLMYLHGDGVDKNHEKAIEWFKKASCQNYDWALYYLGTSYYYGEGVSQNFGQSFKYFKMASLSNNASAFLSLGHLYSLGKGVQKDELLALKNYKKALELGEIDAAFFLGELLSSGEQISNDYLIALMWFKVFQLSGDMDVDLIIEFLEKKISLEDKLEAKEMAEKCVLSGYTLCDVRRL